MVKNEWFEFDEVVEKLGFASQLDSELLIEFQ
jgi:hypothetical protein